MIKLLFDMGLPRRAAAQVQRARAGSQPDLCSLAARCSGTTAERILRFSLR